MRSTFHKQCVYYQKSINIQKSFHLAGGSSRITLSGRAQMSTEICIKLFTRRRIKRRNRWCSFSISVNFYQTILESSPQTRFVFDIKKLLLIDALTFIPRETQDGLLRIMIDLPEFRQIPIAGIPKQVTLLISTVRPASCVTRSTYQFVIVSLYYVLLRHEINLLRRSFSQKVLVQRIQNRQSKRNYDSVIEH